MGLESFLGTATGNLVASFAFNYRESANKQDLIEQGAYGRSSYFPNILGKNKSDNKNRLALAGLAFAGAVLGGMNYFTSKLFNYESGSLASGVAASSIGLVAGRVLSQVVWRARHPKKVEMYRTIGRARKDPLQAELLIDSYQKNNLNNYLDTIEDKVADGDFSEEQALGKIRGLVDGELPEEGISEVLKWVRPQVQERVSRGEVRKEIRDFLNYDAGSLILTLGKAIVPEVRVYDLDPTDKSFSIYDCKWNSPKEVSSEMKLTDVETREDSGSYAWLEKEVLTDLNKPRIIMQAGRKIPTEDKKQVISKVYLPAYLDQQATEVAAK